MKGLIQSEPYATQVNWKNKISNQNHNFDIKKIRTIPRMLQNQIVRSTKEEKKEKQENGKPKKRSKEMEASQLSEL